MKKLLACTLVIGSFAFAQVALGCSAFEAKKKAALADKTITEEVRQELVEFYAKNEELHQDYMAQKDALKADLSHAAHRIFDKYHAAKPKKVITKAPAAAAQNKDAKK